MSQYDWLHWGEYTDNLNFLDVVVLFTAEPVGVVVSTV
jgi:hypothetical protein